MKAKTALTITSLLLVFIGSVLLYMESPRTFVGVFLFVWGYGIALKNNIP